MELHLFSLLGPGTVASPHLHTVQKGRTDDPTVWTSLLVGTSKV
jgi:hypothetical protein